MRCLGLRLRYLGFASAGPQNACWNQRRVFQIDGKFPIRDRTGSAPFYHVGTCAYIAPCGTWTPPEFPRALATRRAGQPAHAPDEVALTKAKAAFQRAAVTMISTL
jgi:hypothetical protein